MTLAAGLTTPQPVRVNAMSEPETGAHEPRRPFASLPAGSVEALLATAARAPSILNTQPWQFSVTRNTIELHADPSRRLRTDLGGREMVISCGAALFGLRLGIAALGFQPVVRMLPDPVRPNLLAKVHLGERALASELERQLLQALPHRHTHRGPFAPGPLPSGLLIRLQHDAVAEHAALALIDGQLDYDRLASIVARVARSQAADENARADALNWTRPPGSLARDGVPASALPASGPAAPVARSGRPGRLRPRDLDLGRGLGALSSDGAPAAATAILLTEADTRLDWLRAGQALHRLLVRAATRWVFASLHTQSLESAPARALIRSSLGLTGAPQVILEFGPAQSTWPTPRRPPAEVMMQSRRSRAGEKPSTAGPGGGTKVPVRDDL